MVLLGTKINNERLFSLREKVRMRGSKEPKRQLFNSPHPNPLPGGAMVL